MFHVLPICDRLNAHILAVCLTLSEDFCRHLVFVCVAPDGAIYCGRFLCAVLGGVRR